MERRWPRYLECAGGKTSICDGGLGLWTAGTARFAALAGHLAFYLPGFMDEHGLAICGVSFLSKGDFLRRGSRPIWMAKI